MTIGTLDRLNRFSKSTIRGFYGLLCWTPTSPIFSTLGVRPLLSIRRGLENSLMRPPMFHTHVQQSVPRPLCPCQRSPNSWMLTETVGCTFLARSSCSTDSPVPWCCLLECLPSSLAYGREPSPLFCHL